MLDDPTADRRKDRPAPSGPERVRSDEVIGPYKVLSLLGEGGFGSVYLAEQTTPVHRRVALKLIKPGMDSRTVVARFEAERQALAMMDHPSLAKVFDAGLTPDCRPFFAMEFVRGEPITRFCQLERIHVKERIRLMIDVCGAVQHAHMKGVLHRDLKPSNILVATVDGRPMPKVIDFGVAKAMHQPLSDTTVFTEMGQLIGTPEYMSPEQARGSADVDTRADIYALGAILYELLTGVTPIDVKSARPLGFPEIERTIQNVQPIAPSARLSQMVKSGHLPDSHSTEAPTVLKRIRGDLDWIVLKCLEKERARRYESAAAMAADLWRYLNDEPVLAGPPTAGYRAMKFVRRHRVAVTTGLMVLLSLVAAVVGTSYGLARAKSEAADARQARAESDAVTEFLTQMIQSVRPDESGRDITVRQVLDDSSHRIEANFSDRPLVEARVRHALGLSYWGLGRLDDAERHIAAVLDLRRRHLGPEHIETLRAGANLAAMRLEQGRLQEAEEILTNVADAFKRTIGSDHSLTLGALSNLAVIHTRKGDLDRALALTQQVVDGQRRAQGPDHPHTLGATINLADLFADTGKIAEAEKLLRETIERWERVQGADKPGTLIALHSLAMLELKLRRLDGAESSMRRVVDGRTRVLGEDHGETLSAVANLGMIFLAAGKISEAEAAYSKAWYGMKKVLGPGHPKTLTVLSQLATILEMQGWPPRSQPVVQGVIEGAQAALLRADLPPDDLNNMAWWLLHVEPPAARDPQTALSVATRACSHARDIGSASLWMYLDTLATAQHLNGRSADALASQREALRLMPPEGEKYRGEMEERAREYEQAAAGSSS